MNRTQSAATWVIVTLFLVGTLAVAPGAARSPGIADIEDADTIFLHEQGLNLSALRDPGTDNPITDLRRYESDDPDNALILVVTVQDDTSFDVEPELFGDELGVYYPYNPSDGVQGFIYVKEPVVSISATLADPYHTDRIEGISVPEGTGIAIKITARDVGNFYHAGEMYPATVDIVVTTPGGAEITTFGGQDLKGLVVRGTSFFTDDPGYPGPIVLSDLETGVYSVRAKWSAPKSFADNAEDSNTLTFSVGKKVGVDITATPSPVPSPPVTTEETTATPTASPTPPPTPEETTAVATTPTGTPLPPSPTPTPTSPLTALGGIMGLLFLMWCAGGAGRR